MSLEEKFENAEAAGLAPFIKKYKFEAALYMFSDVLSPLACLSCAFQKKTRKIMVSQW